MDLIGANIILHDVDETYMKHDNKHLWLEAKMILYIFTLCYTSFLLGTNVSSLDFSLNVKHFISKTYAHLYTSDQLLSMAREF